MTDALACENSTVTGEFGYNGEGEDLFGTGNREQEGSSTPGTEAMKTQEGQEQSGNRKHEEKMLGHLAEETQGYATCKGLFPEGYQMSVTCGGFTKVLTAQDAHNTHTLMDPEVFISGLIAMNKAPQDYTIQELKTILLKNKRNTGEVGIAGMKYRAFGPYNMLMQVDGVWIHQAVMVTLDKRFDQRLVVYLNRVA